MSEKQNDKWYNVGKQELSPHLLSVSRYLINNSDIDDVILTTKEIGFALNALTGRKLVITRRAQNDPFLDMDTREMDAAIILYGNDSNERLKLLKRYNIKYLYWDIYWLNSEYQIDQRGTIIGKFDPLMMFYSQEKEEKLKSYNISYFVENTWVDPALRGPEYKKFDIIFINANNYRSVNKPWRDDLDKYLEEVWSYSSNNMKIAVLYKINI